jgi:hypothetical protein
MADRMFSADDWRPTGLAANGRFPVAPDRLGVPRFGPAVPIVLG